MTIILYYEMMIDIVSFDMNNGHFYRAMRKAKALLNEMKKNKHTDEYYNGSYLMGIIYWYRNNLPLATKFFDQALREAPHEKRVNLSSIYTDYANMLTDEDPQKAEQLIEKALTASGINTYQLTYALTMKGIIAFVRQDKQTVLDCYRQYHELKAQNPPDKICDMYEHHLNLAAMTVNGKAQEAMRESETELDESDRYTIQLGICDYIGDKATAYDIQRKLMKLQEQQNNLIMEDDLNEMASDLQVVEAKREMEKSWMIFLIVQVSLLVVIIICLIFIMVTRKRSLRMVQRHNEELQIANARIEEASKMKTNFIQQISHEIRTPLNILSGFTQIVTTPGMQLDDATKSNINHQITENTDRITGLVNKMLELSDANSRTIIERTDEVPAVQIAAQAAEDSGITQAEHLTFDMQIGDGVDSITLKTNLQQATRALTLLLDNARKFTHAAEAHHRNETVEEKKRALLSLSTQGDNILFVVEDTGIGVPLNEAEHIFDEFVQLDEYYDGTGIGLTVARSIIRRLGGDIVLDTNYTDGARFVMSLPISADSDKL